MISLFCRVLFSLFCYGLLRDVRAQSKALGGGPRLLNHTLQYIEEAPVTVLSGARQTGKAAAILFDIIDPI